MDSNTKKIKNWSFILASQYYKPHIGGIENSLYFLAKASLNINCESIIFVSNKGIGKKDKLPLTEKEDGINIVRYKYPFLPSFLLIFEPVILLLNTYVGFKRIKNKKRFNTIVLGRTHFVVLAALLAGYDKVAYVVPSMIKGLSDRKNESFSFKQKIIEYVLHKTIILQHYFFQRLAIKKSHKNFVFSENMKSQLEQQMNGTRSPIVVNPGVDIEKFNYTEGERNKLRQKYNLRDKFVFLCLGRITETKGYKDVILAFSNLEAKIKIRSKVLIVGEGIEINDLKKLVLDLNLEQFVEFHGSTNKPEEYFVIGDCFMMTSRYEAFGQTILESMASGLPIIAYKVDMINVKTASKELIDDGVNGFFSDFNVKSLRDTMKKVFSLTIEEKKCIYKRNIDKVKNRYQWSNLLIEIKDSFDK